MSTAAEERARTPSESGVDAHIYKVFPNDMNAKATVFGGMIMATVDRICLVVAERHSGRVCVTASVDDVHFMAPARTGDTLIFSAACNRAWDSSMEIGCRVIAEDSYRRESRHVVSAYSTFVALDADGHPATVPPLAPETEAERARHAEAGLRRETRLAHAERVRARRGGAATRG